MLVKYIGRRTVYQVRFGRTPYTFSNENDYTLDIGDKQVINYIFGLPNKSEFEVVEKEKPKEIIEEPKEIKKVKDTKKKTGGKNGKRNKHK